MDDLLILPSSVAEAIVSCGRNWGVINLRDDPVESLAVVEGFGKGQNSRLPVRSSFLDSHRSKAFDKRPGAGLWYRVKPDLHYAWTLASNRDIGLPTEFFKDQVISGWRTPPAAGLFLVLTYAKENDQVDWRLWRLDLQAAAPLNMSYFDESAGTLAPLASNWPLAEICALSVVIIGVGSIGSACAEALASLGIGKLILFDHDRLLQRNLARHKLMSTEIGRYKVNAMADYLRIRFPEVKVVPITSNVIFEANVLRGVAMKADCLVACSDGIGSRRTVNHIGAWAIKPSVFACVLENGSIGEVFRFTPNSQLGCLQCLRNHLEKEGSLDPEPGLEQDYGTGDPHLPMTAMGGDLAIMGEVAGKVAVATLLEALGYRDQRLPGHHAVIGLRWAPGLPSPFDVRPGEVRWNPGPPRRKDCPSCGGL